MSNKLSAVLILCISTMSLSGCDLLRVTGPCYGVGCPAGTAGRNGQYKPGEAPKAQNAAAPAPTKSATAPAQSASAAVKPAPAQSPAQSAPSSPSAQSAATQSSATASTTPQATTAQATSAQTATAQPAPAQNANAEAKPSPFHAIGEFFERLIPHHNSGANSGAGN
jgi:hypothetical protein